MEISCADKDQKAVVVISIFLQSSNEKCNSLQGWMGFFMKSMCVPEKAIEVLAHAGLSISLSSIHNVVTSMSKEISSTIRKEVHTLHAAFAYNNFDIVFNTAQPSLENRSSFVSATSATVVPLHGVDDSNCHVLRSSAALWACDPRNTSPSSFPLMNEMRSFLALHKNDTYNRTSDPTKHSPRNAAFAWHIRSILVHHAAGFRQFQDNLGEPESVLRIPIHKTTQIPCRAMNIKQSTTDGNVEVLDNLFRQGGIGEKGGPGFDAEHDIDMSEHVIFIHGDLLTKERVDTVRNSRSIENTPKNRLQYVIFLPGLFHYKMACADALWRIYIQPKEGREDANSLYQHIGILRPDETGKMVSKPGFRRVHDVVHHDLWASMLDCWRLEAMRRNSTWSDLDKFASSKPSWELIETMSYHIVNKYVASTKDLDDAQEKPQTQRDKCFENQTLRN